MIRQRIAIIATDVVSALTALLVFAAAVRSLHWLPLASGPDPRIALFVLMVVLGGLVSPLAALMHSRLSLRLGATDSLLRTVFQDRPVESEQYAAWWWARLAGVGWLVGGVACLFLVTW